LWEKEDAPPGVRAAVARSFPAVAPPISSPDDARRYVPAEAQAVATLRMADVLHSPHFSTFNVLVASEKTTTGWYTAGEMDRFAVSELGFGVYDIDWVVGFLSKLAATNEGGVCVGLRPTTSADGLESHWRHAHWAERVADGKKLYLKDGGAICIVDREKRILLAGSEGEIEGMLKRGAAAGAEPIPAWPATAPPDAILAVRMLGNDALGKKHDGTATVVFQPEAIDLNFDLGSTDLLSLNQFLRANDKLVEPFRIKFDLRTYEVREKDKTGEVPQRVEMKASADPYQLYMLLKNL
jgi:hypothetical protein